MRLAAENNGIRQLDRELIQLDNRNSILAVAEENSTARNLDTRLIKGGILGDFGMETYNPCFVACFPLNENDVNINSGLVDANNNVLAGNNRVNQKHTENSFFIRACYPANFHELKEMVWNLCPASCKACIISGSSGGHDQNYPGGRLFEGLKNNSGIALVPSLLISSINGSPTSVEAVERDIS